MKNKMVSTFEQDNIQDKKLDNYGWKSEDFLASQELTVTITLGEYRSLVSAKAISDEKISAVTKKTLEHEAEIKELRKELDRLKAENYDLQAKVMTATAPTAHETESEEQE